VVLALLWSWAAENVADLGTPSPKKSYHPSGPSLMRPNELATAHEPPGIAPGCQRRHLLNPFEEDEDGIGIASDVVKVRRENQPFQVL